MEIGQFFRSQHVRGGGCFLNKGTWGCAARKGILFGTSSLTKGILSAILVDFSLGKVILLGNFGPRNAKLRQFL